ncbi:plexin-A4-like [Paramuricea clavata]|nr:plexin-A4-like [Paramuricea clavata]
MFDCIFPTFRKNERPPLPIKFLFDFLDDQAKELNITDPEVMHTWKNNSLPLRFWVNLIKNPNFLFDVNKAPIVDSCLSVIAQLFMDSCSVSEHILGKDSPSNKLLYAKEIPVYKQKVQSFYKDIANAPRLTDEEVKDFFTAHYIEDFNVDSALKELYKYAADYQDELQEALEDARYPQLASKLEHLVAIFTDD